MGNIILVSFADTKYRPTADRLRKEAVDFAIFSSINIPSEKDFDNIYRKKNWFRLQQKGMGYWMWKSYVVKKFYDELEEGDILFYIDAGCVLNKEGKKRFNEYIKLVAESNTGILVFQQNEHIEKYNTKADVFHFFECLDRKDITDTPQLYAGSFFIQKRTTNDRIVSMMYDICHNHFGLLSDNPSVCDNFPGFQRHKYDQSIFSVLIKLNNPVILSSEETYTSGSWDELREYPILSKRLKIFKKKSLIRHRLTFVYRRLLELLVKKNIIVFGV